MSERTPYYGEISIGCVRGDGTSFIRIECRDEKSGTVCFTAQMSVEEFGNAITGLSSRPAKFGILEKFVGCKREHKYEVVKVPDGNWDDRKTIAKKAVEKLNKDGWRGRVDDAMNHHKSCGQKQFRVLYERWVDRDGKPIDPFEKGGEGKR